MSLTQYQHLLCERCSKVLRFIFLMGRLWVLVATFFTPCIQNVKMCNVNRKQWSVKDYLVIWSRGNLYNTTGLAFQLDDATTRFDPSNQKVPENPNSENLDLRLKLVPIHFMKLKVQMWKYRTFTWLTMNTWSQPWYLPKRRALRAPQVEWAEHWSVSRWKYNIELED